MAELARRPVEKDTALVAKCKPDECKWYEPPFTVKQLEDAHWARSMIEVKRQQWMREHPNSTKDQHDEWVKNAVSRRQAFYAALHAIYQDSPYNEIPPSIEQLSPLVEELMKFGDNI